MSLASQVEDPRLESRGDLAQAEADRLQMWLEYHALKGMSLYTCMHVWKNASNLQNVGGFPQVL